MTDRKEKESFLAKHGLRRVINACAPLTVLGGAQVCPEVRKVIDEVLTASVEMPELQRVACHTIARITGAEAGCVTACSSAGITVGVAACITGDNIARIKRLPDTTGMKDEVVIQKGHIITAGGAPISMNISITGAKTIEVGEAADCGSFQLEDAIGSNTAAAVFVAAQRARRPGLLSFKEFAEIAGRHQVPVVVDAAGQMDYRRYIAEGADIVIYSGHKFLGAPTSGMICGRKDLIRAAYLQEFGIGRPMKVGKEGVAGLIRALELLEERDQIALDEAHHQLLEAIQKQLDGISGLTCQIVPEGTETSAYRLALALDPAVSGITAYQLARKLSSGDPMIKIHDFRAKENELYIDPAMLSCKEGKIVADRIREIIVSGPVSESDSDRERTLFDLRAERLSGWPDS
jgi:uncharacterized pyridoxal phosphate-dependent enzyme